MGFHGLLRFIFFLKIASCKGEWTHFPSNDINFQGRFTPSFLDLFFRFCMKVRLVINFKNVFSKCKNKKYNNIFPHFPPFLGRFLYFYSQLFCFCLMSNLTQLWPEISLLPFKNWMNIFRMHCIFDTTYFASVWRCGKIFLHLLLNILYNTLTYISFSFGSIYRHLTP